MLFDRTGVSNMFPADHTYGAISPKNPFGVEDLLYMCPPSLIRKDVLTFLAYANKLRQSIDKKIKTTDFTLEDLFEEILSLNKNKNDYDENVSFNDNDNKHNNLLKISIIIIIIINI